MATRRKYNPPPTLRPDHAEVEAQLAERSNADDLDAHTLLSLGYPVRTSQLVAGLGEQAARIMTAMSRLWHEGIATCVRVGAGEYEYRLAKEEA